MKSILKRSISVILAAIMIVTLLPISVLASAPTQTTEKATDVTATSATLWGYLSKNGGNYFSEYGFYWGTGKNPTKRQAVYKKTASESTAIINGTRFELELTGLKEGQTYYYCTYVKTTGGTIYKGAVGSFDTEAKSNPEVKTLSAEDIGQDKVTLCGKAVKNGGQYFSDYGFYWGTSSNPTKKITVGKKGSKTTAIDTPKEFTYQLSGLKAGTKYYYRAYVKTTSGKTIKGDVLSFTTGSGSAKVNSVKASSTSPYILSQTTFTIKTTPTANTGVIIYAGDYELGRVYDYSKSGSELSYKLKWTFASEGSKLITVYPLDQNGYYVKDGKATTTITVKSKGKCGSPDIQNEDGVEVEEGNSLHVSWKKPTNPKSGVVYNVYLDDVIVPGFDQTNATNIDLTSEQLSVGSHRLTIYGIAKQYSQSDPAFIRIYVTERNTVNPNPPEAAKTDDWNAGTTNEPQPGDFGYVPPQHIHDYQYIETGLGMHLAYCNNPGCDNPQFEAACVYDDNDVCKYCGGNRVEVQNNSIPDWFGDPFGGHGNPFTDDNQNNPVETVNNWSLTYSDDYEGSVGSEKDSEDNNAENVSGENNDSSTDTKIDSGKVREAKVGSYFDLNTLQSAVDSFLNRNMKEKRMIGILTTDYTLADALINNKKPGPITSACLSWLNTSWTDNAWNDVRFFADGGAHQEKEFYKTAILLLLEKTVKNDQSGFSCTVTVDGKNAFAEISSALNQPGETVVSDMLTEFDEALDGMNDVMDAASYGLQVFADVLPHLKSGDSLLKDLAKTYTEMTGEASKDVAPHDMMASIIDHETGVVLSEAATAVSAAVKLYDLYSVLYATDIETLNALHKAFEAIPAQKGSDDERVKNAMLNAMKEIEEAYYSEIFGVADTLLEIAGKKIAAKVLKKIVEDAATGLGCAAASNIAFGVSLVDFARGIIMKITGAEKYIKNVDQIYSMMPLFGAIDSFYLDEYIYYRSAKKFDSVQRYAQFNALFNVEQGMQILLNEMASGLTSDKTEKDILKRENDALAKMTIDKWNPNAVKEVVTLWIDNQYRSITLKRGETFDLNQNLVNVPLDAKGTRTYSSNNTNAVTITEKGGIIKAKAVGKSTITARLTQSSGQSTILNIEVTVVK